MNLTAQPIHITLSDNSDNADNSDNDNYFIETIFPAISFTLYLLIGCFLVTFILYLG